MPQYNERVQQSAKFVALIGDVLSHQHVLWSGPHKILDARLATSKEYVVLYIHKDGCAVAEELHPGSRKFADIMLKAREKGNKRQ